MSEEDRSEAATKVQELGGKYVGRSINADIGGRHLDKCSTTELQYISSSSLTLIYTFIQSTGDKKIFKVRI